MRYIYGEIYYAALWQCLMMERKQKNAKQHGKSKEESVLGVSLDPDKATATTTTRTTTRTACHKGHQSF